MTDVITTRLEGPLPAMEVAVDILKRGLIAAPFLIFVSAAVWGVDGAASTAYGLVIVLVNFVLAAAMLAWAGRISLALMGAAALFGYLVRLGLIFLAVMLVREAEWVDLVALGITLIVTHLGLLFWELRYVSLSLAYPGPRPRSPSAVRPYAGPSAS